MGTGLFQIEDRHYLPSLLLPARETIRSRIEAARVPGAVFDVGPSGIDGWFDSMCRGYRDAAIATIDATTVICLGLFVHIPLPTNWQLLAALFFFGVWAPLLIRRVFWNWTLAEACREEWQALEKHGLEWHFENGHWFRYILRREDGSYQIDKTLRQTRMANEAGMARGYQSNIDMGKRRILTVIAKGIALTLAVLIFCSALGLTWLLWINLWALLGCWYLWKNLRGPVSRLIADEWQKRAYEANCQFIPFARVTDPVDDPMTLETVKKHDTLGDGTFVNPAAASKGLSS